MSPSEMARSDIRRLRSPKNAVDAWKPQGAIQEWEPDGIGGQSSSLTVFLSGAECRFTCTMCDLWRNTLNGPTPPGAVVAQLQTALRSAEPCQWVKLYNASNFFDPHAVPMSDLIPIAHLCSKYERVIVENHPRLLRPSIEVFRDHLGGRLEVAMGLETVFEPSLEILNKESTLDDYSNACHWLLDRDIDIRAFVMLQPPGTPPEDALDWAVESVQFAWNQGARHVSIIPTRGGNGAMEVLAARQRFHPPQAWQLESCLEILFSKPCRRIATVDLWDWGQLPGHCERCRDGRKRRLEAMNLSQEERDEVRYDCDCQLESDS